MAPQCVSNTMTRPVVVGAGVCAVLVAVAVITFFAMRGSDPGPPPRSTVTPAAQTATASAFRSGIPPPIVAPPDASLRTADGPEVVAGIGTRCWAAVCLDAVGPVTNVQPFPLSPTDRLSISFAEGSPDRRTDRVFAVPSQDGSRVLADGRLWQALGGPSPPTALALPPDLPVGRYVWVIQAFWNGKGDVSYGFYIELK